jgi:hypothetical protein
MPFSLLELFDTELACKNARSFSSQQLVSCIGKVAAILVKILRPASTQNGLFAQVDKMKSTIVSLRVKASISSSAGCYY